MGWLAIAWQEALCVHGPGDVQGDPVQLDDELAGLVLDVYALGGKGRRLYDSALYSAPKGTDKSGQAARFALFEALGPCRFAGWAEGGETYRLLDFEYVYEPGEPMGAPIRYPFVRCMATEETQTGAIYDAAYFNLTHGPLSEHAGVDAGVTRTILPDRGEIVPSTASASAKDGGKETFAAFDEVHLYVTPELRRMHATVRRNLAKRKAAEPWSFEPTTMYGPGEGSVAEDAHLLAQSMVEGRAHARLFFDHRQAPESARIKTDAALRRALKAAYGAAFEWMDIDRLVAEFRDPRNSEADLRRYFLNQPWRTASSWIPIGSWEKCAKPGRRVKPGTRVVLAVDGSFSNDSTAVIGATVEDKPHLFVVGMWERPPNDPHWRVSIADVEAAILKSAKRFQVVEVTADPFRWQRSLEALEAEGLLVTEFPQSASRMTPATTELYAAIREKRVSHDGDPAFGRHVYNAILHEDSRGKRLKKETQNSPRKIDAAVTSVMAHNRAAWHALNAAVDPLSNIF